MAYNFRKAMERQESKLSQGRTKIDSAALCGYDSLTIEAADVAKGKDGDFAILNFKELPDRYAFGGKVATDVVAEWLEAYGGDADSMNAELGTAGIMVKFEPKKSQKGFRYIDMQLI